MLRLLTTASKQLSHSDQQSHDLEVEDGVARALVRTLRSSLVLQHQQGDKFFLSTLGHERALRISILCTALDMVLQCSDKVLILYIEDLIEEELVPSLVRIVEIFLPHDKSFTVRDIALSKASRILYLISLHAREFPKEIIPTVGRLLNAEVPSDARIDAACAVASLLAHTQAKTDPKLSKDLITITASVISTLSTACGSAPTEQLSEISKALFQIARSSRTCLLRISSRRDTVVHIVRFMYNSVTQTDALRVSALLLTCEATTKNLQITNPSSGILILRGLSKIAQANIPKGTNQDLAVAILMSVLDSDDWKLHHKRIVIDALTIVAYSTSSTLLRTEVAFGVCRHLLKKHNKIDEEAKGLYPTVIDFLLFPIDSVRLEALFTLDVCTWKKEVAVCLMAEYSFVDNITVIIASNQRSEQNTALSILYNCSKYDACTELICLNSNLLNAIVDHAIKQDTRSGASWFRSLEIILNVMRMRKNRIHFKEYTELLPWLATAAGATVSDDLKEKLVRTIMQLSQVFLESGIPNRFLV